MSHCLLCTREILPKITWVSLFTRPTVAVICSSCERMFQPIEGDVCTKCGRPWNEEICYDCLRWGKDLEWGEVLRKNTALYTYNESMKEMIARWKFRGDIVLIDIFQKQIEGSWKGFSREIDIIIPIPLSKERLYERGFNQAVEIAKLFSQPFHEVLSRVHAEKQSKKSRQERIKREDIFSCEKHTEVAEKRILLVDDIYTTGMTLRHAAKVLKESGAKEVSSFTLAR